MTSYAVYLQLPYICGGYIVCPQPRTAPNIIRVIKSRWVACMGEMRNAYKIWVGKSEGRHHTEDLSIHRKTV
jgi:hypothetical protein